MATGILIFELMKRLTHVLQWSDANLLELPHYKTPSREIVRIFGTTSAGCAREPHITYYTYKRSPMYEIIHQRIEESEFMSDNRLRAREHLQLQLTMEINEDSIPGK